MSEVWYRVDGTRVTAHKVVKRSDKMLVYLQNSAERRERISTRTGVTWHPTWEAAKADMLSSLEETRNSLRMQLTRVDGRMGQIRGSSPPPVLE
jgi:hypothetical protein